MFVLKLSGIQRDLKPSLNYIIYIPSDKKSELFNFGNQIFVQKMIGFMSTEEKNKRYLIIDQQIARHFVLLSKCLKPFFPSMQLK